MNKQINKRNTTNTGLFGLFEKLIRFIPHIYLVIRLIVKFTNYFEEDFYYLKKIFKNTRINIIDIGASDGISALFFIRITQFIRILTLRVRFVSPISRNILLEIYLTM